MRDDSGPRSRRFIQRRLVLTSPLGLSVGGIAGTAHAGGTPRSTAPAGQADHTPKAPPPTPRQARGPFYPTDIPADAGSDLVIERDGRRARGELVQLTGRILDIAGRPSANAQVEIWQCNASGRYHHPRDTHTAPLDPLFRGYGVVRTDVEGRYAFRTIRPVPYPGRTPHIHFAVDAPAGATGAARSLVTQMYVRGEPQNTRDGLLSWLAPAERERLMAHFVRVAGTTDGKTWRVTFDVVLA